MTLITFNGGRATGRSDIAAHALAAVKRIVLWPIRVARARHDLAQLARFSEYGLRDIGLSGQDLRNATALPLDADATLYLARQAADHVRETWQRR